MNSYIDNSNYTIGGKHKLNTFRARKSVRRDINFGNKGHFNVLYDIKHHIPICNEQNMNYYVFRKKVFAQCTENMDHQLQTMKNAAKRPLYNETLAHGLVSINDSKRNTIKGTDIIIDTSEATEFIRNFHVLLQQLLNNPTFTSQLTPKQLSRVIRTENCYPDNNKIRLYIIHNTNYSFTIHHQINGCPIFQKKDNIKTKRIYILRDKEYTKADRQLINGVNQRKMQKIWKKKEIMVTESLFNMLNELKRENYIITPDIMANNNYLKNYNASYVELMVFIDDLHDYNNRSGSSVELNTSFITRSWESDTDTKFNLKFNEDILVNHDNTITMGYDIGLKNSNREVMRIITDVRRYTSFVPTDIDEEETQQMQNLEYNMRLLQTHSDTNRYRTLSKKSNAKKINGIEVQLLPCEHNVNDGDERENRNMNIEKHKCYSSSSTMAYLSIPASNFSTHENNKQSTKWKTNNCVQDDGKYYDNRKSAVALTLTACKYNNIDNGIPSAIHISEKNNVTILPNKKDKDNSYNLIYLETRNKQFVLKFDNKIITSIPGKTIGKLSSLPFDVIKYQKKVTALICNNKEQQLKMYTLLIGKTNADILNDTIIKGGPNYYHLYKLLQNINGIIATVSSINLNHMPSLYDLVIEETKINKKITRHIYCVTFSNIDTSTIMLHFWPSTSLKDKLFATIAIKKRVYEMEDVLFIIDCRPIPQEENIDVDTAFKKLYYDILSRSHRCFGCIDGGFYTDDDYNIYLEQALVTSIPGNHVVREVKNKSFIDEKEKNRQYNYLCI